MLYQLLATSAAAHPDQTILVDGDRKLSYQQLLAASRRLTGILAQAGFEPGDRAAIWLENSPAFAAALFAVSHAGGAAVLIDPGYKTNEVLGYARRANAACLLTSDHAATALDNHPDAPPVLTVPDIHELIACAARPYASAALDNLPPPAEHDDARLAVVLLSSGTAGPAKLVPKTAAQARAAVDVFAATVPYRQTDQILAALPFNHSFGFFNVLLAGIAAGATLHLNKYSPRQSAEIIAARKLTVLPATPFMFRMMAATDFQPVPDFAAVRIAISAGAALPAAVLAQFRHKFGIDIWQSYGTTESGPATLARHTAVDTGNVTGQVGTPYAHVAIRIRNENGAEIGPGLEGEVAVHSAAAATQYLNDADTTGNCFQKGWVLTGDVGYIDPKSNQLIISGRRKRMINVAGKKVAPDEVEECLLRHPAVADVLVVGDAVATGEERVAAFVVVKTPVAPGELRDHCARNLADFKVPRRLELVPELKRTPMGKIPFSQN